MHRWLKPRWKPLKSEKANLLAAMLAFLVYGSWAGWVNSEYGLAVTLRAGLGQGIYAFFSTWVVTAVARKVLFKYGLNWKGMCASFGVTFLVMLAFPVVIHNVLMTPDIIEAILPGLIWGSGYIAVVIGVSVKTAVGENAVPLAGQPDTDQHS